MVVAPIQAGEEFVVFSLGLQDNIECRAFCFVSRNLKMSIQIVIATIDEGYS